MRAWRLSASLLAICVGAPFYFVAWTVGQVAGFVTRGFIVGWRFCGKERP